MEVEHAAGDRLGLTGQKLTRFRKSDANRDIQPAQHNAYDDKNGRYRGFKHKSGKINAHLAKNLMKQHNVNNALARELNNSKPKYALNANFDRRERNKSMNNGSFDNDKYLKAVSDKGSTHKAWDGKSLVDSLGSRKKVFEPQEDVDTNKRDVVSEVDYSDSKSALSNLKLSKRRKNISDVRSQLTEENLKKIDDSGKPIIRKGGGASIYSDARSQLSAFKSHLSEISSRSKQRSKSKANHAMPIIQEQEMAEVNEADSVNCESCGKQLSNSEVEFHNQIVQQKEEAENEADSSPERQAKIEQL